MTRAEFHTLCEAGDRMANEFLAEEGLGYYMFQALYADDEEAPDVWFDPDGTPHCDIEPYATQPDGEPRSKDARLSWALFGEMCDVLPGEDGCDWQVSHYITVRGNIRWAVNNHGSRGRLLVTIAATRCAAVAEALLAALGKFEGELQ